MNSLLCAQLGITFPLIAFSHCRDVVAAVSKARGFGVFGAGSASPAELETELRWIDAQVDGHPYGVDLLIPENLALRTDAGTSNRDLMGQIPPAHQAFVRDLLRHHGVDPDRVLALVSYFVGQGVGLVGDIRSVRSLMQEFMTEFADALEDMRRLTQE